MFATVMLVMALRWVLCDRRVVGVLPLLATNLLYAFNCTRLWMGDGKRKEGELRNIGRKRTPMSDQSAGNIHPAHILVDAWRVRRSTRSRKIGTLVRIAKHANSFSQFPTGL